MNFTKNSKLTKTFLEKFVALPDYLEKIKFLRDNFMIAPMLDFLITQKEKEKNNNLLIQVQQAL
jgi:hypothetical protein